MVEKQTTSMKWRTGETVCYMALPIFQPQVSHGRACIIDMIISGDPPLAGGANRAIDGMMSKEELQSVGSLNSRKNKFRAARPNLEPRITDNLVTQLARSRHATGGAGGLAMATSDLGLRRAR
jgi:hypothetical protein